MSPQEWAIDDSGLRTAMAVTAEDQIGANVYFVGAGPGYLGFLDTATYPIWQSPSSLRPPSEREAELSESNP